MARYRPRPFEVEAFQWDGEDWDAAAVFCGKAWGTTVHADYSSHSLQVTTAVGRARCAGGDWLVALDEHWEVFDDKRFQAAYEPADVLQNN